MVKQSRPKLALRKSFQQQPILVTGGAGFIGSHLVEALIDLQANVTVFDDLSTGNLENLTAVQNAPNYQLIIGDLRRLSDLQTLFQTKFAYIFHLAAATSVPESQTDSQKYYDINLTGTVNLLAQIKQYMPQARLIFSSSSAVYGAGDTLNSENDACRPANIYGLTKWLGEEYCRAYSQFFALKTVCLRYFNVYGPRQNITGGYAAVYAKFAHNLAHNLPITIYGDGQQKRDFVPVATIVNTNLTAATLDAKILNGQAINVASGAPLSILNLLQKLQSDFPNYHHKIEFLPARNGDLKFSGANLGKHKTLLGIN